MQKSKRGTMNDPNGLVVSGEGPKDNGFLNTGLTLCSLNLLILAKRRSTISGLESNRFLCSSGSSKKQDN